jgi:ABC-2 type transport system permease protein
VVNLINLIYKDIKLINKRSIFIIIYAIFIAVFFQKAISSSSAYIIAVSLISYTLTLYPTGYDDIYEGDKVLNSLPVKRFEIVISRYISSILFLFAGYAIILAASIIGKNLIPQFIKQYADITVFLFAFILVGFLYSITFPVYYQFGITGEKIISTSIFLLFLAGPGLLVNIIKNNPDNKLVKCILNLLIKGPASPVFLLCTVTLVIYILSLLLSIKIYEKKDL